MTLRLPYAEWIKRGCPSAIVTIKYEIKGNEQMKCSYCRPWGGIHEKWCTYFEMEKEKPQMTREEAIKKVEDIYGQTNMGKLVDTFEALGLIKLDKCEETVEELLRRCGYNSADRILMILSDNGYDVVKRNASS